MAHIVMVLKGDIRYDGRVRKEIGTLVKAGNQVELVTSDFSQQGLGGEDLGIKIHYLPMSLKAAPSGNFVEQIRFNRRAASVIKRVRPSHIHCHDLTSLLAGFWAKKETRSKLIFDAHELMPESKSGIKARIWDSIERRCVRRCDHIIIPEKNRIAYFKKKYPNIQDITLLENFPRRHEIPDDRPNLFRRLYPIRKDQTIILYTGLVAFSRSVEKLIESMTLCGNEFVLVILGRTFKGYENTLRARINDWGIADRVFLHDPVPHSEILKYMASCDIGTAFYPGTNLNSYYCAYNKLYEYIALGKAVLTNNYPGLLEVVEQFGQGICLSNVSAQTLAEAYSRAVDASVVNPGTRKFFWEEQEDRLSQFYKM